MNTTKFNKHQQLGVIRMVQFVKKCYIIKKVTHPLNSKILFVEMNNIGCFSIIDIRQMLYRLVGYLADNERVMFSVTIRVVF